MSRALLDREGALRKALTLAQVRVCAVQETPASACISQAQLAIHEAERRPSDGEALTYLRRAHEHIQAADKALSANHRGDCVPIIAKCEQLARDAMQELASA